jgi:hypothetical protein
MSRTAKNRNITRKNKRRNSGGTTIKKPTLKERLSTMFTGTKYKVEPEILDVVPEPKIDIKVKADSIKTPKNNSSQFSFSQLKTIYERMDSLETKMKTLEDDVNARYRGIEESFDIMSKFIDEITEHPGIRYHLTNKSSRKKD